MSEPLAVEVSGLSLSLHRGRGQQLSLVRDVSLEVRAGEAVGLVGESGSGKSLTLRLLAGLRPAGATVGGVARVLGKDVLSLRGRELRKHRMKSIGMIFQDPRAHIDPVRTVGDFLTEALTINAGLARADARRRVLDLLDEVGVGRAEARLRQYPHELSGGILQRVMIASVLAAEPSVLLADEPTTALDVTTQSEVMALIDRIRVERELAMIFVTHDLDLAAAVCDRITVMYAGCVVERQTTKELFAAPMHPYTQALIDSRPELARRLDRLPVVGGRPAAAWEVGAECVFASRCPYVADRCKEGRPQLDTARSGGQVACVRSEAWRRDVVMGRGQDA